MSYEDCGRRAERFVPRLCQSALGTRAFFGARTFESLSIFRQVSADGIITGAKMVNGMVGTSQLGDDSVTGAEAAHDINLRSMIIPGMIPTGQSRMTFGNANSSVSGYGSG